MRQSLARSAQHNQRVGVIGDRVQETVPVKISHHKRASFIHGNVDSVLQRWSRGRSPIDVTGAWLATVMTGCIGDEQLGVVVVVHVCHGSRHGHHAWIS